MDNERMFYNWVNYIEIEISSLCNRKCDYCPSSKSNRVKERMPKEYFQKIISELQEIDYAGSIAFHQYNEPLLDLEYLLECISYTKEKLPAARLLLYTNGDFITKEIYELLIKKGIIEIHITCHLDNNEKWDKDTAVKKIKAMKQKIGLKKGYLLVEENRVTWRPSKKDDLQFQLKARKMQAIEQYPVMTYIMSTNFYAAGSKRMNMVDEVMEAEKKVSPKRYFCPCIFTTLNISYKGNGYLCWDCCEGYDENLKYKLGNIKDMTIYELYRAKYEFIKRYLSEDGLECCETCYWNNI